MRIRCILFGCWCDENSSCPKCGAALYDADFVQIGRMAWIHRLRSPQWSRMFNRKCEVCGKRMWLALRGPCCSKKCYDEWIPF